MIIYVKLSSFRLLAIIVILGTLIGHKICLFQSFPFFPIKDIVPLMMKIKRKEEKRVNLTAKSWNSLHSGYTAFLANTDWYPLLVGCVSSMRHICLEYHPLHSSCIWEFKFTFFHRDLPSFHSQLYTSCKGILLGHQFSWASSYKAG